MLVKVVGPAGVRKPAVARWIRERYGLCQNDVVVCEDHPCAHPSWLVDLIVEVIAPHTEWPRCPAPADVFRMRLPEEFLRSAYFDIDCNNPAAKNALAKSIGPALDARMKHFGVQPDAAFVFRSMNHDPSPGELWKNKHTGEIATIVRIDEVQLRPHEIHRVVVWTCPGSAEEHRHSLDEHERDFVPRSLATMFGPVYAGRIAGWHEHWELVIENHASTGAVYDLTVKTGTPAPDTKEVSK